MISLSMEWKLISEEKPDDGDFVVVCDQFGNAKVVQVLERFDGGFAELKITERNHDYISISFVPKYWLPIPMTLSIAEGDHDES